MIGKKNHCVYKLILKEKIIYVGFTSNMKRREAQHKKTKIFESMELIQNCSTREFGLLVESYWIWKLRPVLNTKVVHPVISGSVFRLSKANLSAYQELLLQEGWDISSFLPKN